MKGKEIPKAWFDKRKAQLEAEKSQREANPAFTDEGDDDDLSDEFWDTMDQNPEALLECQMCIMSSDLCFSPSVNQEDQKKAPSLGAGADALDNSLQLPDGLSSSHAATIEHQPTAPPSKQLPSTPSPQEASLTVCTSESGYPKQSNSGTGARQPSPTKHMPDIPSFSRGLSVRPLKVDVSDVGQTLPLPPPTLMPTARNATLFSLPEPRRLAFEYGVAL